MKHHCTYASQAKVPSIYTVNLGSLAGAARLLDYNTAVLRFGQHGWKSCVAYKGTTELERMSAKAWPSDLSCRHSKGATEKLPQG